jgi:hypothetical protein
MATAIIIQTSRSTDSKSITITSESYLDLITSIVLNFYTTSTNSVYDTYTLTELEVSNFVSNGTITLTFQTMFASGYVPDNWYDIQMVGNDGDYLSNLDGFASYAYLEPVIYINNLNNLHTPDEYRGSVEKIALQIMWLQGLKYLDTSTVNDRRVKSLKRMKGLLKLNR